ncbi:MAG: WXG100 family type VII secretion target [Microbacteriaceae bacterium]
MTHIQIEPDSVDSLSSSISTAAGEIETKLGNLTSASATLQGEWAGEAMNAFAVKYSSWSAEMDAIAVAANAAAGAATTAATAFRTADERVGALWSL